MRRTIKELPVWQCARELIRDIYAVTRRPPFARDAGLCDQMQRAAVSIGSNIAEGHERGSTADLIQFLFYAKGSAGEVRAQLYFVEDAAYLSSAAAEALRAQARLALEKEMVAAFCRSPAPARPQSRPADFLLDSKHAGSGLPQRT